MATTAPLGQEALNWTSFRVGGTRLDAVTTSQAIGALRHWVRTRDRASVAFCTASTVVEANSDAHLAGALEETDLVTADGMPLVWLGRRRSAAALERVYGPDFMVDVMQATGSSMRHFFYGGAPGVAEEMARRLQGRFSDLEVAGVLSPELVNGTSIAHDDVARINAANPDIVWVGLGHPKQEKWMRTHRQVLDAPVLAGVGAAFDFLSGRKQEAPAWMKRSGLQWLHRLLAEPHRLWRRYLIGNVRFVLLVASCFGSDRAAA
ncbi:MAG: WecB/TagA/CpsF family glycosyltransferase [Actinomycetota bacterium]|nr:WecB/TagA/CpsF family glycosyltransferase [Actinomycetota bacterium]